MQQQCVCVWRTWGGQPTCGSFGCGIWSWTMTSDLCFFWMWEWTATAKHIPSSIRGVGALLRGLLELSSVISQEVLARGRSARSNACPRTWTYITLPEGCYVKTIPRSLFFTAWDDIKMLSLSWKDRLPHIDVNRCVSQLNCTRNQKRKKGKM